MVRFKHRYLVATVSVGPGYKSKLKIKQISEMLKESISANFGDFGEGQTSRVLQVCSFDSESGVCIIRTSAETHRMVRTSLSLINKQLSFNVEAVAGCRRSLKGAAMGAYARAYAREGLDPTSTAALLLEKEAEIDSQER